MQTQILGDYRIIKQIGHGSLGIVYLAEHRYIKKHYVLKVLPAELSNDRGFVQRFEEEVAKISTLEHPHIVKIHNVSFADGFYFLVTDCVVDSIGETTNLAQYMSGRKERLREDELLSLLKQVASALDYAHARIQGGAIAHRALKLNNILVGKGNPGIEVFISDFGLSRIIGPGSIVCRSFKITAEALGKLPYESAESGGGGDDRYQPYPVEPAKLSKLAQSFLQNYAFLAPEQKRLGTSGIPSDIYAFGVLTYYLITGVFPEGAYEQPNDHAKEYLCNWNGVVNACLQSKPEKRPLTLLSLLERCGNSQVVLNDTSKEKPATIESIKAAVLTQSEQEVKIAIKPTLVTVPAEHPPVQTVAVGVETSSPDVLYASPQKMDGQFTPTLNTLVQRDPAVSHYQPEKKEIRSIEAIPTEMVVIQGGQFMRGSNEGNRDEMPRHQIYLDSFALDIHPVTNEQFVRYLEYMGGEKDQHYNDLIRLKDSRINRSAGKLSIESGYARHPVVGVTWYGAVGYAKWIGKRLPTEAEWEIGARGGFENYLFPSGDNIEKSQANFFSSDTTAVMSYSPNGYGLYDMVGNVYEWCQDWYGYNFYETSVHEPRNPKGPLQGVYRVLRGGCWKSVKDDLRCSHRHRNNPGTVNGTCGFRCAIDVRE